MPKKKTHEEYVAEIAMKYPTIKVMGRYMNAHTKISHRCLIHDIEWDSKPNAILNGYGCPMCGEENRIAKQTKSHDKYVAEVDAIYNNIEVVGQYSGNKESILHRCKIDGYEWFATPNNILRGHGCPKCARKNQKTAQEYIEQPTNINKNIIVCEDYINSKIKILHKCKVCGHSWFAAPNTILSGFGCPECAGTRRKTQEEYVNELETIHPNIRIIGTYINRKTKIAHECLNCGHNWNAIPGDLLNGHGCPRCASSNGEKRVGQWLIEHNVDYIYQKPFDDCRNINPLPFDFYIPKLNILIEFDGIQHFEPVDFAGKGEIWALEQFKNTQRHDAIKNKYCEDNHIKLLRIPYFKNVEEELNNFLFI